MRKILFFLTLIMVSCVKDSAQSIPNEYKLKKNVDAVFDGLINKNVEALLLFLSNEGEIEVGVDQYLPKSKIIDDFHSKGRLYAYLFDSKKYYELNKSFLRQFNPNNDINIAISDVFAQAKKLGVSYKYNPIVLNGKIEVVHVYVDWKGKKEFPDNWRYMLVFTPIKGDWKLVSLNIRN